MSAQYRIDGLIIASGLSKRMGTLKPLLLYNDVPFLVHILSKMLVVCDKVVIVTGYKWDAIISGIEAFMLSNDAVSLMKAAQLPELPRDYQQRIRFIINPDYALGMYTSLQKGLASLESPDWVLYHFTDQPHIPLIVYELLQKVQRGDAHWVQPTYNGKKGHPIVFHRSLIQTICELNPPQGLRTISRMTTINKKFLECSYEEILFDIDTPEDYQLLRKKY